MVGPFKSLVGMTVSLTLGCSFGGHEEGPPNVVGPWNERKRRRYVDGVNLELNGTDCITEGLLASSNYKGFPIVSSDGGLSLVGYIERSEIRYVLGKFGVGVTIPNSN